MTNSPEFDAKCGKCAKCVKMCNFGGCHTGTPKNVTFLHPRKRPPKKRQFSGKTPKNGFSKNPSRGAQKCGESRQIIYCLDTRSGPQNGGISRPPQNGGFWGVPAKHVFRAKCAKCVFLHTPRKHGGKYPDERHRGSRRVQRIDQRSE
jgi:hypothetical protein